MALRQQTRRELLAEARKHPAMTLLRQIPSIGPIRAALLIALMETPNRFRTKRQLWAYCGLALRTYTSGEYRFVGGQLKRSKKALVVRGLNINHNRDPISSKVQRREPLRPWDLSKTLTKSASPNKQLKRRIEERPLLDSFLAMAFRFF
jgi:transposase